MISPAQSTSKHGETMEATSALMMTLGVTALLASWVLLLIQSWREDFSWGLCSLLLPPLSYVYGIFRLDKAGEALALAVIGWLLVFLAF
jgi:hypothetical protein